jgi:hypothetical protein
LNGEVVFMIGDLRQWMRPVPAICSNEQGQQPSTVKLLVSRDDSR